MNTKEIKQRAEARYNELRELVRKVYGRHMCPAPWAEPTSSVSMAVFMGIFEDEMRGQAYREMAKELATDRYGAVRVTTPIMRMSYGDLEGRDNADYDAAFRGPTPAQQATNACGTDGLCNFGHNGDCVYLCRDVSGMCRHYRVSSQPALKPEGMCGCKEAREEAGAPEFKPLDRP